MTDTPAPQDLAQRLDLANPNRTEFYNAMVHLYRGEKSEATAWRTRIDTTSNWAVVISASALSFVFSDQSSERHVLIPIVSLFIAFLMMMEARRYRFYDIFRTRVRVLEMNFYHPMLSDMQTPLPNWAEALAHDLEWPEFHMPWWEALGRRLRRNYQFIFVILAASWIVVLLSHPYSTTSWGEIIERAAIGPFSGEVTIGGMLIFYSALTFLGVYSFYASRYKKGLPAGHPGRLSISRRGER